MKDARRLDILLKLRNRLGGRCNSSVSCCPKYIDRENSDLMCDNWDCCDCGTMYQDFPEYDPNYCPCGSALPGDVVIARLEEEIADLKERLS